VSVRQLTMHPVLVSGSATLCGIVACVVIYSTGWGLLTSALIAPAFALALPFLAIAIGIGRLGAIVASAILYVPIVLFVAHILVATPAGIAFG
jgi:hypothetical protein